MLNLFSLFSFLFCFVNSNIETKRERESWSGGRADFVNCCGESAEKVL